MDFCQKSVKMALFLKIFGKFWTACHWLTIGVAGALALANFLSQTDTHFPRPPHRLPQHFPTLNPVRKSRLCRIILENVENVDVANGGTMKLREKM